MANRISTIIDVQVNNAITSLRNLKNEVSNAEGFMGKFKAGAKGLGDSLGSFLQSGPGIAAIGAGIGAAGKFAIDAVSDFSALGVEVGQLADATGLSADAASRWLEVAGDIGIESGTIETGLGKLNKTIAATPGLFADAGVEIAKTKDGAVDVNGTFLNLIKRLNGMTDPAERAALASKTLGKGWQGMAELVGQGSDKLTKSLADVSDAKVFDDDKIQKARDFRAATDALGDSMQEFTITMGTELAPALSDVAAVSADLIGVWGKLFGGAKDLVLGSKEWALSLLDGNSTSRELIGTQKELATALSETDRENRKIVPTWVQVADAEEEATEAARIYKQNAANTARSVKQNIDEMIGKWDELTGNVEDDKAWLTLQGQFDELRQKAVDAFTAAAKHADDAEEKGRDYQIAIDDLILDTINYGKTVADLPPEKVVLIKAAIEAGDIDRAEAMLAILTRNREVSLDIVTKGGAGYGIGPHAAGGRIPMGEGVSLVGERGPELISAPGAHVYNAGDTAAMLNGNGHAAPTINLYVTVNAGVLTNGRPVGLVIAEELRKVGRQYGAQGLT